MRKFSAVPGLFAGLILLSLPAASSARVFLSINIAPPVLQVYQQPLCPQDGYIWTPGYWGYGDAGYYWIPGAWLAPPQEGFLWTPGYWGFNGGLYSFNAGYWGPTVGFYGGVNYGFGYGGNGFDGGRWQGGHFAYNTAVSRVNTSVIHNTYNQNVSNNGNRTSFNGAGGISARPSSEQTAMARQHGQYNAAPVAQQRAAAGGPVQARQQATENHGRPANTEAARPAATQASASNRNAETQNRMATRAAPSAARPEERQAASPRPAPQQTHAAAPQQTHAATPQPARQQVARSEAPSRPAPQQQRPQAARAAAPEHAAAARPEGGREERK